MASAAAPQYMFEGCIKCKDIEKRRRPYHKNCKCALHQTRCLPQDVPCNSRVSYPLGKSWSTTSLSSMKSLGMNPIRRSESTSSLKELELAGSGDNKLPIGRSWSGTSLHSLSRMESCGTMLSELREEEEFM